MLDRSKTHHIVYGLPGATYEQNGKLYSADGTRFFEEGDTQTETSDVPKEQKVSQVYETGETDWSKFPEPKEPEPEVVVVEPPKQQPKSTVQSERMKAHWAKRKAAQQQVAEDSNVVG